MGSEVSKSSHYLKSHLTQKVSRFTKPNMAVGLRRSSTRQRAVGRAHSCSPGPELEWTNATRSYDCPS
ncbi:hypothetical protein RRG08_055578 [Elysia crispata]|uniref:Uncharacterized protein n=1 Tax=Elysia crispata TaxID=231223 RepID=A0AAE1B191_9GAST|nr:hypothetical protein RRG08_055578 [Elysia crispata]